MAKYNDQTRRILKSIFATTDKPQLKNPDNWIRKMTNLVGGTHYQHAHSDQAWPFDLEGEKTFPFVATHGFGVHPFEMWLLPRSQRGKQEYGILHTFPPTALLLMRGDCERSRKREHNTSGSISNNPLFEPLSLSRRAF